MKILFFISLLVALVSATHTVSVLAAEVDSFDTDLHYTPAGFFDVHVCNWPEKGVFYMLVFSTVKYDDIKHVDFFNVDGKRLGAVDWNAYRLHPKLKDKRIYIINTGLTDSPKDGWFRASIQMKDGKTIPSKDYVIHGSMGFANNLAPMDGSVLNEAPSTFTWMPPAGSTHWVVTIRDVWDNDAVVYTSNALTKPTLTLPDGILKKGGVYAWRVHSRDGNGNILLGDFNHGSMSLVTLFSIGN